MNAIEIAKKLTARTAEMKDWRIRNKYNRKMRQIARDLVELNGGYIIATPAELQAIYDVQVREIRLGDRHELRLEEAPILTHRHH